MIDDSLIVFPVSKSTHMLFINGAQFERFSHDTGITYDDLATWDGFFNAAEEYYNWSHGMPFCAMDYMLRAIELYAISSGTPIAMVDGWYDTTDPALKESFDLFARALVQGHIMVSDLYSNTQIMTGEVPAGLGSSAAILYYNDTVTYADNSSEPMHLVTLPMPCATPYNPVTTQAGVGLCAMKTTDAKAEAASLFAHWITDPERNLDFVADSGYMPVNIESYQAIETYDFKDEKYATVYTTLDKVQDAYTSYIEPAYPGYYEKVTQLYTQLRDNQGLWAERYKNGEEIETLTQEAWDVFCAI